MSGQRPFFGRQINSETGMNRITIVLDDSLLSEVDKVMKTRGYQNRSEAIRDLTRAGLRQMAEDNGIGGECLAALVYTYDHGERDLPKRLTKTFHEHHDLSVSTLHVHLNHDSCLEVNVLRGRTDHVRHLADHVIAERGVRHGRVVMFPAEERSETHTHRKGGHSHTHLHLRKAG
jgi:CopG family transcriptional regulator, nickel-responsive regulator